MDEIMNSMRVYVDMEIVESGFHYNDISTCTLVFEFQIVLVLVVFISSIYIPILTSRSYQIYTMIL